MKKAFLLFISLIISVSCTTVDTKKTRDSNEKVQLRKNNLETLDIKAKIQLKAFGTSQNAIARIFVKGADSVAMNIYGPFGIVVGNLLASDEEFVFVNFMENRIYRGEPTAENMRKASGLEISFRDLIRMLRCESPEQPSMYKLDELKRTDGNELYKYYLPKKHVDFVLFSPADRSIIQFQRKNMANRVTLKIAMSEFTEINDVVLPMKVDAEFPQTDGLLNIEYQEIKVNTYVSSDLAIKIPSGFKEVKF